MHGIFNWQNRYAIHQTFHQETGNQIAHYIATPIQLFAMIKLLAIGTVSGFDQGINIALVFIIFLSIIYTLIHLPVGLIVSAYLTGCWYIASYYPFSTSAWMDMLCALGLFAAGVFIQIRVGHHVYENKKANLGAEFDEFFQTYNPMIFVLIFFFPFLDLYHQLKNSKIIP
ncbi:MAG: DUF962 domain-containing protein [Gammaproteobacteria bacterium]|nr:DUF962 domain-containing protein [Gammaproteobacteria bacterium]